MPEIIKIIKKYSNAEIVFFTNATVYENRELLMLADIVEVTISAATPESYERIHGKPYFNRVVKTVEWLEQQPDHPDIHLRMVVTPRNQHEVEAWKEQWKRFKTFQNIATSLLVDKWKPDVKLNLDGEVEQMKRGEHAKGAPCLFWNLAAINVLGDLYQCCKAINHVYGNLNYESFQDVWDKRLANNRNTSTCRVCPVRVK